MVAESVLRLVEVLACRAVGRAPVAVPRQAATGVSGPEGLVLSYALQGLSAPVEFVQVLS